jgi:hypothetical protein
MNNEITIRLADEDRVRIDNLTAALIANGGAVEALFKRLAPATSSTTPNDDIAAMAAAAMSPKDAPQRPEEPAKAETPETEETPAPTDDTPPWEPDEPTVTLAQIQQKVMQLAAGFGGAKKAQVRAIINAYANKVSDLPEDKWTEVWGKLTALEREG